MKFEVTPDSSKATRYICVVDWSTVTSILGGLAIFNEGEMDAPVCSNNCLCFIQEPVLFFYTEAFIVATKERPKLNMYSRTYFLKYTQELAVRININNDNHTKCENNLFYKYFS